MKKKILLFLVFSISTSVLGFTSISQETTRAGLLPHRHKQKVEINSKPDEGTSNFRIEKTTLPSKAEKANEASNPDKTWRAFTVETSTDQINFYPHLIVEDLSTQTDYEIKGFDFPQRPFSDLAWVDKGNLVFDIWITPHNGIHYKIDVINKRPVLSASFFENQ